MDVYAENILDHFRHPRGKQALPKASIEHEEVNLSCGDALTIQLAIDNGNVAAIGWSGSGCAISQAGMSLLWEALQGKTMEEMDALTRADIEELLGVPIGPRRFKCAFLCLHTLKNTLRKAKGQEAQGWLETAEEDEAGH